MSNITMEEQFVPYELALKLKELGFGSNNLDFYLGCFAYYGGETSNLKGKLIPNNIMRKHAKFNYSEFIIAPLWQQAFDWFREKHNLSGEIYNFRSKWWIDFWNIKNQSTALTFDTSFVSYKEARLECLKKLIDIKM